jgi:hypothetical protein
MSDPLNDAIAAKRRHIATLRERIAELSDVMRDEEIRLEALEEVAANWQRGNEEEVTPAVEDAPLVVFPPEPQKNRFTRRAPVPNTPAPKRQGNYRRAAPTRSRINDPIETLPLRVLLVKALAERFPNGATSNQLHEYITGVWGKASSMGVVSVDLSNLIKEGEVYKENRLWYLADKGESE